MDGAPERDWNLRKMPDQAGRIIVVTGANSGIGFETARALARKRARVIVAGRSVEKCKEAIAKVIAEFPEADLHLEPVDLADLGSIADFARRVAERHGHLDVLVNNAGIMSPSTRKTTVDGFELQIGVNFLAHFALTARLFESLRRAPAPRVVTVSSVVHKAGRINLDDLQWEHRRYSPTGTYHDSKLATLMFALELQRRSDQAGWGLKSVAAHPGIARTELMANGPGLDNIGGLLFSAIVKPFFSHSAADGALPILFAATAKLAKDGGYYGPSRRFELVGPPAIAKVADRARDPDLARALWEKAETLTGLSFGEG